MRETKAPVGLEQGDIFKTDWGDVEIIEKDGDEYLINDKKTDEEVWLDHEDLVEIMVGSICSVN